MAAKIQKKRLSQDIFFSTLMAIIISVALIGLLWMYSAYSEFKRESEAIRERLITSYKELVKNETNKALSYISYQKDLVEERLRESIKARVYEAHGIASNIQNYYDGKKSPTEIKEIVKEALRNIRFNNGRGYFFAFTLGGIEELFADRPEMEGKDMLPVQGARGEYVVRDMLDIVKKTGEGFYRYTWTKPEADGYFPKIAFAKTFEPFRWVIGTGEYLDDVENDIQQEVIRFIEQIRYGDNGYIFATDWNGLSLTSPAKNINMWDVTDSNGVKIVQEFIRIAREGSGYLKYVMPRLEDKRPAAKLSYVIGIPDWEWYVGTGVYVDDIEAAVNERKKAFEHEIIVFSAKILILLVALVLFAMLIAMRIASKTEKNINHFSNFLKKASMESLTIKPELMDFAEFEDLAHTANDMIRMRNSAIEKLGDSETRYKILFESAGDGIYVHDFDGKILDVNQMQCARLGYSREEYLKLNIRDIISKNAGDKFRERMEELEKTGNIVLESVHIKKDGQSFPIETNSSVIEYQGKKAVLAIIRDITERKKAEEEKEKLQDQLKQAQRMEAVGTLAGGVAHDFNNLLMGIQGRTSLMLHEADSSHPFYDHLIGIENYVESAADLTKQLLGFARGGKYKVEVTDLNILLKKSSEMFGRTKKEIAIHTKYQEDLWTVEMDRSQIEQVLLNLYVNAWQSMPGGGDLYLETENIVLDTDYVKTFQIKAGKYVKISVTDNGVGMDKETQQRIFDPFFTTKKMGRGTGLGLSSAYGIIKNHGGFILVDSEKGKGATFKIYLPASDKKIEDKEEISKDVIMGKETILLVDDEDMIIDVGEAMLERLGYQVITAKSGREAIDIFTKDPDGIDIIILDMIMPDLSGSDAFDRIKDIDPGVKVLLSSGYSINGKAQDILDRGCNGFIQKPFGMDQLAEKVRAILDN